LSSTISTISVLNPELVLARRWTNFTIFLPTTSRDRMVVLSVFLFLARTRHDAHRTHLRSILGTVWGRVAFWGGWLNSIQLKLKVKR
jgi:hypothetical protein